MKLSEFFTESNGRLSSTRLLMIMVLLLLITDWIWSLSTTGTYNLSWEKVALITSVFGLKSVQKYMENENVNTYPVDNEYYNEDNDDKPRNNKRNKTKTY